MRIFTLRNRNGVEMGVTNYGARITTLRAPDRLGRSDDIVLGYESLDEYLRDASYFGAVVGRYGNRIAGGRFTLDNKIYDLAVNNGPNSLHGGRRGFDKVVWEAKTFESSDTGDVAFEYVSPDGEEGYPGELRARVTYTLTADNTLVIDYEATTNEPTPVNLTQHTYWNLSGGAARDILDHVLTINADSITPVDSTLIPTGGIASVHGTPFDFRMPARIGARIDDDDAQIGYAGGYDHNYVLNRDGAKSDTLIPASRVVDPESGRVLEILTTEPGLQFYSGNFLDGSITGKAGAVYRRRFGLALETQHFPDSPNHPNFPSTILRPGQTYRSRTVFRIGIS